MYRVADIYLKDVNKLSLLFFNFKECFILHAANIIVIIIDINRL